MGDLMKKFIAALSLLFLTACAAEPAQAGTPVTVYVLGESEGYAALDEVILFCPEGEYLPLFALEAALSGGGGRSPFPEGTAVSEFSVEGGAALVVISAEAAALTGFPLTMARACVVLTMTGLDGIERVEFKVEGQEAVSLGASDFVRGALVLEDTEHSISIYFAGGAGVRAVPETRTLVVRETDTLEWYLYYMLEEMIAGPRREGLLPVLPEGTRLLSVSMEGGVCGVNFSGDFVYGDSPVPPFMTLYCLVRSVTAQPGVTALRLLADGQVLESYGGIDISGPLTVTELTN
jgi:germination protein M